MDLAERSPEYIEQLAKHHTGGLLKVAPEHVDPDVLQRMRKPPIQSFFNFEKTFHRAATSVGKDRRLIPYFMAGHPGCDLTAMIRLATFLKRTGYRPDKVQDFIPLPMDAATCMYYAEIDPSTDEPVYVAKGAHERRLQRALLQFWKPENYADVREALETAGREDLIGDAPKCLISTRAPKAVLEKKRSRAPTDDQSSGGYRPHRKTAPRKPRRR